MPFLNCFCIRNNSSIPVARETGPKAFGEGSSGKSTAGLTLEGRHFFSAEAFVALSCTLTLFL